MPEPGRPDQAVCAAEAGREHWRSADERLPYGAGAVDLGDYRAPPAGEVFCGVVW